MFSLEYHFFKMYVCISSFKLSFISNQKCFAICYFRVNLLFLQILSLPKSNFERTLFRITSEWIPLTESFSKTEPIPIEIASRMHYSHFLIGNPSRLRSKAESAICFWKRVFTQEKALRTCSSSERNALSIFWNKNRHWLT